MERGKKGEGAGGRSGPLPGQGSAPGTLYPPNAVVVKARPRCLSPNRVIGLLRQRNDERSWLEQGLFTYVREALSIKY